MNKYFHLFQDESYVNKLQTQWWKFLGNSRIERKIKKRYNKILNEYSIYCKYEDYLHRGACDFIILQNYFSLNCNEAKQIMQIIKKIEYEEKIYLDNIRIADKNSIAQIEKYKQIQKNGCCGFYDKEFIIGDKIFFIGGNYGH